MRHRMVGALAGAAALLHASSAAAYIGPGAGVSLFGALIGLVVAVVSAIGFVLLWPIRAMLRRRKEAAGDGEKPESGDAPGGAKP